MRNTYFAFQWPYLQEPIFPTATDELLPQIADLPSHAPPLATAALPIPKPPIKILPVILPPAKGRYAARVEPLSEMSFPVVPQNTTTFPETEAPAL